MSRREARALRQAREGDVIFEGSRTSVLRRRSRTVLVETSVPRRVSFSDRSNQGKWELGPAVSSNDSQFMAKISLMS